jgi:hypothetical protein
MLAAAAGFLELTKSLREVFDSGRWVVHFFVKEVGDQLMLRSHITAPCIWVLAVANALVISVLAGCSVLALTASLISHVVVPALLDVRMRRQLRAMRLPARPAHNCDSHSS